MVHNATHLTKFKFSTVSLSARKSWTLQLLAFDEYCRFDTFAFFGGIKQGSERCMEKIYGNVWKPARVRRARTIQQFFCNQEYNIPPVRMCERTRACPANFITEYVITGTDTKTR
jgi:hypothetical protein